MRHKFKNVFVTEALENPAISLDPTKKKVYVDATFTGPSSDGTFLRPYLTVQEAVDDLAAHEVFVREGTYEENVLISHDVSVMADGPNVLIDQITIANENGYNMLGGIKHHLTLENLVIDNADSTLELNLHKFTSTVAVTDASVGGTLTMRFNECNFAAMNMVGGTVEEVTKTSFNGAIVSSLVLRNVSDVLFASTVQIDSFSDNISNSTSAAATAILKGVTIDGVVTAVFTTTVVQIVYFDLATKVLNGLDATQTSGNLTLNVLA